MTTPEPRLSSLEETIFTALRSAWPRPEKGVANREVALDVARARAVAKALSDTHGGGEEKCRECGKPGTVVESSVLYRCADPNCPGSYWRAAPRAPEAPRCAASNRPKPRLLEDVAFDKLVADLTHHAGYFEDRWFLTGVAEDCLHAAHELRNMRAYITVLERVKAGTEGT